MENGFGEIICTYRQLAKMTQEELAVRLGVTPQAVSKWERGNGMPDLSIAKDICNVLKINANKLLGVEEKVVENGNPSDDIEIKNNLIAEPLVLEFAAAVIPCVVSGLQTDYVNQKRLELVKRFGILIPFIRLRDNAELGGKAYRILSYDEILQEGTVADCDDNAYREMIDSVFANGQSNYAKIINKQIVKTMIDNLKENYPGVAEGLVPEIISYLQLERKLQAILNQGGSIRDLIHILEEMEEAL